MPELLRLLPVSVEGTGVSVSFLAALAGVDSTTVFAVMSAKSPNSKERCAKSCRFSDLAGRRIKSEYRGAFGPGRTLVSFDMENGVFGSVNQGLRVASDLGEFDLVVEK